MIGLDAQQMSGKPTLEHAPMRTRTSYVDGMDSASRFGDFDRDLTEDSHSDAAQDLGADDASLRALLARAGGPVDWRSVSAQDAAGVWAELREWVDWLRVEFGFDHRLVPSCWFRHSAIVNVLSALRDHWLAAYDPMGSLLGPGEWHRGLMQLEVRLRDWASRTGCAVGAHRPDVLIAYLADDAAWEAHVANDVTERRARVRVRGATGPALDIALAVTPTAETGGGDE
jgi:hypothetical protein